MRKFAIVLAFLAVTAGQALAGPLTISSGGNGLTQYATPSNNDILNGTWRGQQFGYLGGQLQLTDVGTWEITYEYVGAEAGYTNYFRDSTVQNLFNNKATQTGSIFTQTVVNSGSPMTLDFRFIADVTGFSKTVTNGSSNVESVGINFFLAIVNGSGTKPYLTNGYSAYIALDDQASSSDDDNHDDLVVKVTAKRVPDGGATAMLLGGALVGIGVLRRRFRS
jgi:hypothetical protein